MSIRSAQELAEVTDPAWPLIVELLDESDATVLPLVPDAGLATLHRLQVTAHSFLGAMALNSGGIIADHGWFRLYGGGAAGLPDLASINGLGDPSAGRESPGHLLVGADAVGGLFAIDGGGLGVQSGEVCYLGPDTLSWGGMGGGYTDFVTAVLSGSLGGAFESLRWPSWIAEVSGLTPDQGIAFYPPPFTAEGQDISATSRNVVPLAELHDFFLAAADQTD